ncbi:hypothetical protein ACM01_04910 [Streptomyces viridochromogenes]|uniref:Uncharacterized protein n=1 Tax=Streptomyces viridochromogenes TaxID=1938 RepID=A0A0J7ZN66_STRVR|nr:hypothetical protein [Streptomyces viridochromogenes]KMS76528.1 hypothetical protein ACM01_04910 [Streptomyces viridochromogenes]KOG23305.1 hypothetical protein ADK35_13565 [Streptomyces viridochromogenes]KOG27090.1 hypothetical protein ADK36_00505 [Streptomyces viridochromogenes]
MLLPPSAPDKGSGDYDTREATGEEDHAIKNKMGFFAMSSPAVLARPKPAKGRRGPYDMGGQSEVRTWNG